MTKNDFADGRNANLLIVYEEMLIMKRKREAIIILGMATVITTTSTFIVKADDYEIQQGDLKITVPEEMLSTDVESFLNVRLEPTSQSKVIAKLIPGQSVEIVEYLERWVKIKIEEQEGYVYTDYTLTGEELGQYVENNLDLFKKIASQSQSAYQAVYKTEKAAIQDKAVCEIQGVANRETMVYKTKSTKKTQKDEMIEVKKCMVLERGDGLRLRSKPDLEHGDVYDTIDAGEYLDFISYENSDWLKVQYKGKVGYVAWDYVQIGKVKEPASNLIDKLKEENRVTVLDIQKTWAEVKLDDGTVGFVKRKYIDFKPKAAKNEKNIVGWMENGVSYEVLSIKDNMVKIALPNGDQGYTKSDALSMEIAIEPPEVDYSVIPDFSGITIKEAVIGKTRKDIVEFALQFIGNPYVWGGTSLTDGADCSGFTQQVFQHAGISINRCSFDQVKDGKEIAFEELKAGDLVFYWSNEFNRIGHVAIYIGEGKVVHASSPKTGIKVSAWNYRTPYKAVDIIGD